jgi:hypothetical protein
MPRPKRAPHDLLGSLVLVPSSCFGISWAKQKFGSNHEEYLLEGDVGEKKMVKNKELFEVLFKFDDSTYHWDKQYISKYVIRDVSLLGEPAFVKGVITPGLRYKLGIQQATEGNFV